MRFTINDIVVIVEKDRGYQETEAITNYTAYTFRNRVHKDTYYFGFLDIQGADDAQALVKAEIEKKLARERED